ncbi:hypothetical protein PYCC9005_002966 [Savitreella phatthalungensis]
MQELIDPSTDPPDRLLHDHPQTEDLHNQSSRLYASPPAQIHASSAARARSQTKPTDSVEATVSAADGGRATKRQRLLDGFNAQLAKRRQQKSREPRANSQQSQGRALAPAFQLAETVSKVGRATGPAADSETRQNVSHVSTHRQEERRTQLDILTAMAMPPPPILPRDRPVPHNSFYRGLSLSPSPGAGSWRPPNPLFTAYGQIPGPSTAREPRSRELEEAQRLSSNRFKDRMEDIFNRYSKDLTGVSDEIDIRTGKLIVDNGHLETLDDVADEDEEDEDDHRPKTPRDPSTPAPIGEEDESFTDEEDGLDDDLNEDVLDFLRTPSKMAPSWIQEPEHRQPPPANGFIPHPVQPLMPNMMPSHWASLPIPNSNMASHATLPSEDELRKQFGDSAPAVLALLKQQQLQQHQSKNDAQTLAAVLQQQAMQVLMNPYAFMGQAVAGLSAMPGAMAPPMPVPMPPPMAPPARQPTFRDNATPTPVDVRGVPLRSVLMGNETPKRQRGVLQRGLKKNSTAALQTIIERPPKTPGRESSESEADELSMDHESFGFEPPSDDFEPVEQSTPNARRITYAPLDQAAMENLKRSIIRRRVSRQWLRKSLRGLQKRGHAPVSNDKQNEAKAVVQQSARIWSVTDTMSPSPDESFDSDTITPDRDDQVDDADRQKRKYNKKAARWYLPDGRLKGEVARAEMEERRQKRNERKALKQAKQQARLEKRELRAVGMLPKRLRNYGPVIDPETGEVIRERRQTGMHQFRGPASQALYDALFVAKTPEEIAKEQEEREKTSEVFTEAMKSLPEGVWTECAPLVPAPIMPDSQIMRSNKAVGNLKRVYAGYGEGVERASATAATLAIQAGRHFTAVCMAIAPESVPWSKRPKRSYVRRKPLSERRISKKAATNDGEQDAVATEAEAEVQIDPEDEREAVRDESDEDVDPATPAATANAPASTSALAALRSRKHVPRARSKLSSFVVTVDDLGCDRDISKSIDADDFEAKPATQDLPIDPRLLEGSPAKSAVRFAESVRSSSAGTSVEQHTTNGIVSPPTSSSAQHVDDNLGDALSAVSGKPVLQAEYDAHPSGPLYSPTRLVIPDSQSSNEPLLSSPMRPDNPLPSWATTTNGEAIVRMN